jgi:DNA-binding protein Fis
MKESIKESFDALMDHLTATGFFLEQAVEVLEQGMIERALKSTKANQSEAAKLLGIHRNTLQRKMRQYKINGKHTRHKPAVRKSHEIKSGPRKPMARANAGQLKPSALTASRRRPAS